MPKNGQLITQQVYEDSEVVEGYAQRNATKVKQKQNIENFSKLMGENKKVLDLGCGTGFVWISLKSGKGRQMVKNDKYNKPMEREFILWEKDEFLDLVKDFGLILHSYFNKASSSKFMGKTTQWHCFIFRVDK